MPEKYHTDLPDDLATDFKKIIEDYYLNDAEAVRDAIRRLILYYETEGLETGGSQ